MLYKKFFIAQALLLLISAPAFSSPYDPFYETAIDYAMDNISSDTNINTYYSSALGTIGDGTSILKDSGTKVLMTNWSNSAYNHSTYQGEIKANNGYDMWLAPAHQLYQELNLKSISSGADVHDAIAKSLGMNVTSGNDIVLEIWATTDTNTLFRPTLNPINNVLPRDNLTNSDLNILSNSGCADWATFLATDTDTLARNLAPKIKANTIASSTPWTDEQALAHSKWLVGQAKWAFNSSPKSKGAPWSGLGYTYDWAETANDKDNIVGLSEYVIKSGNTNFEVNGIYSAQSYIYRYIDPYPGTPSTWSNGDFEVRGDLDTLWTGRRFQPVGDNVTVTASGSIANGEGVLISSLGYTLNNAGSITMADNTLKKFGVIGSEDITVLFLGETSNAANQKNTVINTGTIGSAAIKNAVVAFGNTDITNSGDIIGNIYVDKGNANITSTAGSIDGSILTGNGNDNINLSNTTVGSNTNLFQINTGKGVDTITIGAGSDIYLNNVQTGAAIENSGTITIDSTDYDTIFNANSSYDIDLKTATSELNFDDNATDEDHYVTFKKGIKGVAGSDIFSDSSIILEGDSSNFLGNFSQTDNAYTYVKGVFFGGDNDIDGGEITFLPTASLSSGIDVAHAAFNIHNVADTLIDASTLTSGLITYDGQPITLTESSTLGLFNGTRFLSDISLNPVANIGNLNFGNGSGVEGNIILQDKGFIGLTPYTSTIEFHDGAYTKPNSTLTMGLQSSLDFQNKNDLNFHSDIISASAGYGLITKMNNSALNLLGDGGNFDGILNIFEGDVNFKGANPFNGFDVEAEVYEDTIATIKNETPNNILNIDKFSKIEQGRFDVLNEGNGSKTVIAKDMYVGNPTDYSDGGGTANIVADIVEIGDSAHSTQIVSDSTVSAELNIISKTATFKDPVLIDGANSELTSFGNTTFEKAVTVNSGLLALLSNATVSSLATTGNATLFMANNSINTVKIGDTVLGGDTDLYLDSDGVSSDIFNTTAAVSGTGTLNTNNHNFVLKGINFINAPQNANFTLTDVIKADNLVGTLNIDTTQFQSVRTPIGNYAISATGGTIGASLTSFNPEAYRAQVSTVAQYANQLNINNILFDHVNLVNQNDIIAGDNLNRYAATLPQFAPYQYSKKDGGIWYKAYGSMENLQMSPGLDVRNYAYGSLIGADFPQRDLKNGWKLTPTAYVAYNGGHQTYEGIGMYQNGGQGGLMATFSKDNFITSLLGYGGGFGNSLSNPTGDSDTSGTWFAGVASKSAYNFELPHNLYLQPTMMVAYNIFGEQNFNSAYGNLNMNSGLLNGINVAPGLNLIWNKETFSLYATTQLVFNIMGGTSGSAGNVSLPDVRMNNTYFEYGLGFTKKIKDRLSFYSQVTARAGVRFGVAFQGGLEWKF